MTKEKQITWLGKEKEKKALEKAKKHMEKVQKTTKYMSETIKSFSENKTDMNSKVKKTLQKEKQADKIKKKILERLSKGNFSPPNREKILRLLTASDDIADNARAAANKLKNLNPDKIDPEIKKDLAKMGKISAKATNLLKQTYTTLLENPENTIKKTNEVEKEEEKMDSFRAEQLNPKIISWGDKNKNPGTTYMLKEIEANIEETVDQAENCADSIREIAISLA